MSDLEKPSFSWVEKLLFASAALIYGVYIARGAFLVDGEVYFSLFDDAMISMRYAQNLAEGHGLVWNPGERVEGYTNFLWTLWMAFLHLLPIPDSKESLLVMLTSAGLLLANGVVVREIARIVTRGDRTAILGSVIAALFSYPLMFWGLRGMEVALLVFLVDVAVLCSLRLREAFDWRVLGVLALSLVLALLTRTDSAVPSAVVIAFTVFWSTPAARVKTGVVLALACGLTMLGHTTFRELYYHDPLPNTYYLKVFGTPLFERVSVGSVAFVRTLAFELWPFVLVPIGALLIDRALLLDPTRLFLLTLLAGQCAYSIYVGGDAWEFLRITNRYISIVLPIGALAFFSLFSEIRHSGEPAKLRAFAGILAVAAGLDLVLVLASRFSSGVSPFFVWGLWAFVYVAIQASMLGAALYARKAGVAGLIPAWFLPLMLCLNGGAYAWWLRYGGQPAIEEEMTHVGRAVERATLPGARIAVTWAGAPVYFSHREGVDLLGKCDAYVSHLPSHLPFHPGHSKWDIRYSIETYKPDMVLQLMLEEEDDPAFFKRYGYTHLANGFYVLEGSTKVVDTSPLTALPYKLRTVNMGR